MDRNIYPQWSGRSLRIQSSRAFEVAGTSTDAVLALADRLGLAAQPHTRRTDLLNGRAIIVHRYELPEPPFTEENAA